MGLPAFSGYAEQYCADEWFAARERMLTPKELTWACSTIWDEIMRAKGPRQQNKPENVSSLIPQEDAGGLLGRAATMSAPVPVLGDVMGLLNDAQMYRTKPEERTPGNFALTALGALPFVPAMAGTFAGVGAKTADVAALGKAQAMAKANADPVEVWKATGWTDQFPDKKWRFEIPDNKAKRSEQLMHSQIDTMRPDDGIRPMGKRPIPCCHDDLRNAYPSLDNIRVAANVHPFVAIQRGHTAVPMSSAGSKLAFSTGLGRQHKIYHSARNTARYTAARRIGWRQFARRIATSSTKRCRQITQSGAKGV